MTLKNLIRNMFAGLLATLAHAILRKYRPTIIMVTGSVGKTSTKDAVAAALSDTFYIRKSDKSMNSDFGVPLTIIGAENPWSSILAWLSVFGEALALIILPNHYPSLLVLEVGADRPGDLEKILKYAKPDVVVVTLLPSVPVHVEAYANPDAVREEEFEPARALADDAPLIFSADDPYAKNLAAEILAHPYTFGTTESADVRIENVRVWNEDDLPQGMQASLHIKGKQYDLKVCGAFGRSQLFAPAAAVATSCSLGMTPDEALAGLESYLPPPGRGRLFKGKKETTLIDDSYNSSPVAVEEALYSLSLLPDSKRKVVILGDMLELGRYSVAEHERIGHIAKESSDVIVTVGMRARAIGEAARTDGMADDSIHTFDTAIEAAEAIDEILQEGDVVLIKGSQGMRMERIVRPLLADFADVSCLVRQEVEWQKR